ncbi:VOC family protein [Shewanella dokdonensis]|uniref:VOC family protein n=1 Tax=Shewanella dokdonensis TaxID=712036 RepID=A0ABX8DF23_9GAMM|nr:VOC family protein [Shewanella dokdonensis]MCL1076016.1 VOC family protein [Shewanella dokdonensis]QVK23236.1 VOC family protein [Shewanella dokdonensis]
MSQVVDYPTLQAAYADFAVKMQTFIHRLGLQVLTQCDHVAIRVNSQQLADDLRQHFLRDGELLSDKQINGRPILIIKLSQALSLGQYHIPCIELPYPKDKVYPEEGWEHIELVLPCGATDCTQLQQALLTQVPTLAPVFAGDDAIRIKYSSPAGAAERLPNPTIAFQWQGLCVKVHPHSIAAIIASENTSS